jgi:RimJ/RimL family protein N-acetyltransferase
MPIVAARLELIEATPAMIRAELESLEKLGALLAAAMPEAWPPEFFERDDLERALAWAEAESFDPAWGMRYFLADRPRRLVGVGGFFGPPKDGAVMLGYAVARPFRGGGFATEATLGMVDFAFADPRVQSILAETLPELAASMRVLEKAGFWPGGPANHPGAIRFEIRRNDAGDATDMKAR